MKQKLKKIFEKLIWWSGVITIGIIFGLGIQLVLAWTEPSIAPPGSNVEAPINVSSAAQYKSGPLGIGGLLAAWNGFWLNNNGQDVSGKVLTADAQGFGSWAAGSSGVTMMSARSASTYTHAGACQYCYNLSATAAVAMNGDTTTTYTDWRLPTIGEAAVFEGTITAVDSTIWTATPYYGDAMWSYINLSDGFWTITPRGSALYVRCVR